jgi:hypothetical protein
VSVSLGKLKCSYPSSSRGPGTFYYAFAAGTSRVIEEANPTYANTAYPKHTGKVAGLRTHDET